MSIISVMEQPLVSVITPHKPGERYDWIFDRCIASVQGQSYPHIEHVIISDGPDAELAKLIARIPGWPGLSNIRFDQLPVNPDPRWGTRAREYGCAMSEGELIAYLDDDDAYRPEHCALLVRALQEHPEAGLAYSRMASHGMS